jgi:hypothetical protein
MEDLKIRKLGWPNSYNNRHNKKNPIKKGKERNSLDLLSVLLAS